MIYELHLEGCGLKLRCDIDGVELAPGVRGDPAAARDQITTFRSIIFAKAKVVRVQSVDYAKPNRVPGDNGPEPVHLRPETTPTPPTERDLFPVDPVVRALGGIHSRIEDVIDLLRDIRQSICDKL